MAIASRIAANGGKEYIILPVSKSTVRVCGGVPTVIVPNQRSSSKSVNGSLAVALLDVEVSFSGAGLLLVAVKVP